MDRPDIINILLVEDDPADQKLMRVALTKTDVKHQLHIEGSGEEGLAYLELCRKKEGDAVMPDLILLDLRMSGMGGKEFLRRVKNDMDLHVIPVVVITASELEADIRDCYKLHAAGYIVKSTDSGKFERDVEKVAKYWFSTVSLAVAT